MKALRRDRVPGTKYRIYQEKGVFSYSVDSVFLGFFGNPKGRVADLGCGTGYFLFHSLGRKEVLDVTGVELQREVLDLTKMSVKENALEEKVTLVQEDLRDFAKTHKGVFDTVFANPPYYENSLPKRDRALATAKHESGASLWDFVESAAAMTKFGGKVYFVLQVPRLPDLMVYFRKAELEPKRLAFLAKKRGEAPFIFALEGRKKGGKFLTMEPVYNLEDHRSLIYEEV